MKKKYNTLFSRLQEGKNAENPFDILLDICYDSFPEKGKGAFRMTEQAADESPETGGYPERASLQTVNPGGAYRTLAASYDALMLDADYFERVTFLEGLFREAPFPVGTVLDLGCGTGTVAWLLAERGYRMIGVDASEEMLSVARGKAAKFPGDFPPPRFWSVNPWNGWIWASGRRTRPFPRWTR